jgi:riboflavin kinase/FMN adenylyltransferase
VRHDSAPRSILTIGTFDGVHTGHAALVRHALQRRATAGEPAGPGPASAPPSFVAPGVVAPRVVAPRVVALCFDPHPATRLRPDAVPGRLTTFDRRAELLRALGVDDVVRLQPTDDLLALSPIEFVERVLLPLRPAAIVEGPDFRFGKARAGDVALLAALGRALRPEHAFDVDVVAPVEIDLDDQTIVRASSTMTRWLLAHGRVRDAARLLGRPHRLHGTVHRGDRRGRTIGFPTANLATDLMLPADGVYAAIATLPDGATHPAAVNIGTRPTFNGEERRVEAHVILSPTSVGENGILSPPNGGDGSKSPPSGGEAREWRVLPNVPEYGWPLSLDLVGWVRDQVRFPSLDALVAQLARDCAVAARAVRAHTSPAPAHPPHAAPEHARA